MLSRYRNTRPTVSSPSWLRGYRHAPTYQAQADAFRKWALGSCFAYARSDCVLTAAHCVTDLKPGEIWAGFSRNPECAAVKSVHRHPGRADLAILRLERDLPAEVQPFQSVVAAYLQQELGVAGYPIMIEDTEPARRVIRAYSQRVYEHVTPQYSPPYRYDAVELNIGLPRGISGAPVFDIQTPPWVVGIATESIKSYTTEDSRTVEETPAGTEVNHYMEFLHFGVALSLAPHIDWVTSVIAEWEPEAPQLLGTDAARQSAWRNT